MWLAQFSLVRCFCFDVRVLDKVNKKASPGYSLWAGIVARSISIQMISELSSEGSKKFSADSPKPRITKSEDFRRSPARIRRTKALERCAPHNVPGHYVWSIIGFSDHFNRLPRVIVGGSHRPA